MPENNIPVNIPGGKESIFDGAGAIKDIVSPDAATKAEELLRENDTEEKKSPEMVAVEVNEFMRRMRTKPIIRDYKKIGRNDPCPCGSGLKYKNCCLASGKYEATHQLGD